jgi:diaminopimelate epimerase
MEFDRDILFYKMHGSGNDFVLIPFDQGLDINLKTMSKWAKTICTRKFSVGADGLIFLTKKGIKDPSASYKWHFYNSDGSRAEMCGNGSRCAARLAYELGLAPAHHIFETDAGSIKAEVLPEKNRVKVQLTPPTNYKPRIEIDIDGKDKYLAHYVNTGVPHAVLFFEDTKEIDINYLGRKIRFHETFKPEGTNVNFVQIREGNHLFIRTYERGVEGETYACGTGAAASAYIAKKIGYIKTNEIDITTSGGENLLISLDENDNIYLTGNAVFVFEGKLNLRELGL